MEKIESKIVNEKQYALIRDSAWRYFNVGETDNLDPNISIVEFDYIFPVMVDIDKAKEKYKSFN